MATLDPAVRALLDTVLLPRLPPYDPMSLRLGHQASVALLGGKPAAVGSVDGFVIDADSHWTTPRLAVRRYRPAASSDQAIVWLHGGGWVVGSLDGFDLMARALAAASGRQVFMVDYRLAPEAPFPAGIADSCAALDWIIGHADALGIDPTRVTLGGDSAGGHLAITAARHAARAGRPGPAALLLLYPVTDARMSSDSYGRFAQGFHLSAEQMAWFWSQFVPQGTWADGQVLSPEHPDLSPLLATDLAVLPPALVVTAECDVLHDEGVAFKDALQRAGVACEHLEVAQMIHGFIRFDGRLKQPAQVMAEMAAWLNRRFG